MKFQKWLLGSLFLILGLHTLPGFAQVDQGQTGAWYMYMWNTENRETGYG